MGTGVINNHPIGVWWTLDPIEHIIANCYAFNEDLAKMPAGVSFNVESLQY